MRAEVVLPPLDERRNLRTSARQHEPEHVLHPLTQEQLDATGSKAGALDAERATRIEQHVVLHLVAEHGGKAAVQLEQKSVRQYRGQISEEALLVDGRRRTFPGG